MKACFIHGTLTQEGIRLPGAYGLSCVGRNKVQRLALFCLVPKRMEGSLQKVDTKNQQNTQRDWCMPVISALGR